MAISKLYTARCGIGPFEAVHLPAAVRLFTDSSVREFLGGPIPREYAEKRFEDWLRSEMSHFAIIRMEDGAFLGAVDITPYHESGKLELSYMFLPEYWGNGYAFESIQRILQYCAEELHMENVVSETQEKNLRSRRLLERLGYSLEKRVERFGAWQCVYVRLLSGEADCHASVRAGSQ